MPGPGSRFFWILGLLAVASCAAYSASVLAGASLAQVQALDAIAAEHEHWHIQLVTENGLHSLRLLLGLTAAVLSVAGVLVSGTTLGRAERVALQGELRTVRAQALHRWAALPRRAKLGALLFLGLLTTLRIYFSITKPLHAEEIASYEYFVSKGLLAVSAYYPIPNNHILSNTLSWTFFQLSPAFWWSTRLPVLLVATVGTAGLFTGLLCWSNFRVALWAAAGFSWLQLSLYNASAGRGYWLLIALVAVVFFSTLALTQAGGNRKAAWFCLLVASLAGCYTVPTFAYALASALAWLSGQALWQRDWPQTGRLLAVGATIAAGCLALYAPLLLISGHGALFGNGFVTAQPTVAFWTGLPAYLWHTEGLLAGQRTVGSLLVLAVLAGTARWLWWGRQGVQTPPSATAATRLRLGNLALWFFGFPYVLVLAQRVFPPERVLLYKSFFLFVMLALLVDSWLQKSISAIGKRWSGRAYLAGFALFAAYQTYYVEFLNRQNRAAVADFRAGFEWLRQQPPGSVLVPEPMHELYFRYYAHTAAASRPWQLDMVPRPTRHYAYVVAFPNKRGAYQPQFGFPPAYANPQVEIYKMPQP